MYVLKSKAAIETAWEEMRMQRVVRCCALSLALLSAASVCEAETLDCWLLDGSKLDRARQQGSCLDTFARNTKDGTPAPVRRTIHSKGDSKHVAAAHSLKAAALPSKPKRADSVEQRDIRPETNEIPSWSSPREEMTQRSVDADIAQADAASVQAQSAMIRDPVTDALYGLQRDFEYFVSDLERDFRSFGRLITGADRSRSISDFRVSER